MRGLFAVVVLIEQGCGSFEIMGIKRSQQPIDDVRHSDLPRPGRCALQTTLALVSHPGNWRLSTCSNDRVRAAQPTDPVHTVRLVLTPVGAEDVDDLILLHSDPVVARWTGPWSRVSIETWTTDMAERWTVDGVGKWLAHDRSNGSLVGRGGFTRIDLDGEAVLELGWAVRDALTGRGYATEIGRAALDWAAAFFP